MILIQKGYLKTTKKNQNFSLKSNDVQSIPLKWDIRNESHHQLAEKIVQSFADILAVEKRYYLPNKFLPYNKNLINKSIFYLIDYQSYGRYKTIKNNDEYLHNLNQLSHSLNNHFVETDGDMLPFETSKNYNEGKKYLSIYPPPNEADLLDLIDWRTEEQWIIKGVKLAYDYNQIELGKKCLEKALEINPKNEKTKQFLTELS